MAECNRPHFDLEVIHKISELSDRCAKAEAERDALAAKLERMQEAGSELADLMDGVRKGDYTPDSFTNQPMREVLADTPTTSLACLKAQWQAEILEESMLEVEREPDAVKKGLIIAEIIKRLRRQAKRGES